MRQWRASGKRPTKKPEGTKRLTLPSGDDVKKAWKSLQGKSKSVQEDIKKRKAESTNLTGADLKSFWNRVMALDEKMKADRDPRPRSPFEGPVNKRGGGMAVKKMNRGGTARRSKPRGVGAAKRGYGKAMR
jgi:hypothetical protein